MTMFARRSTAAGQGLPRSTTDTSAAHRVPTPYAGPGITQVTSDAGPLWLESGDGVMLPYLVINRTWEPEEGELLRSLVKPGDVFVDVGANVGYFVRLIATHCGPAAVHAFEPQPTSSTLLALNSWDLPAPVTVWPLALADAPGTVVVSTAEHNVGDTRVSAPRADAVTASTAVAAVARMDDLLTGRVDVVKIDVQGYESEVIRGMTRIAAENPRIVVVVEFWPAALRERGLSPEAVLAEYRAAGYLVSLLRGSAPVEAETTEIMHFCDTAGPDGQANLVLRRA
ncbi:MAG: FkbM family methyltransferase [Nakamurella sp.]